MLPKSNGPFGKERVSKRECRDLLRGFIGLEGLIASTSDILL